jgi:hypothetical protein
VRQAVSCNGCTPRWNTLDGDALHQVLPCHDTHVQDIKKNVILSATSHLSLFKHWASLNKGVSFPHTHTLEWLILCVSECPAVHTLLPQAKWRSGGWHVHDNGTRSHTNMHQKAKRHIRQHARAWWDTSGLHGNHINYSSPEVEC